MPGSAAKYKHVNLVGSINQILSNVLTRHTRKIIPTIETGGTTLVLDRAMARNSVVGPVGDLTCYQPFESTEGCLIYCVHVDKCFRSGVRIEM